MREASRMAAQGDVLLRKVGELPDGGNRVSPRNGRYTITNGGSGHNHEVADAGVSVYDTPDSLVSYMVMEAADGVVVEHMRPFDTHESIKLLGVPGDVWEIRRQREHTPDGWRRVED